MTVPSHHIQHNNAFAALHPACIFLYFLLAIILSVLITNPILLTIDLVCAASFYLFLKRRRAKGALIACVIIAFVIALINPLFNTRGDTILFVWIAEHPYTYEALIYGLSTGLMFASALLWFFNLNEVMSSDKITYLTRPFSPSITLLLNMVLRLVPSYTQKAKEIRTARAGMGKYADRRSQLRIKMHESMTTVSTLTSWALEDSLVTSDSMKSRGFGSGKRTSYARYTFTARDAIFFCIVLLLGVGCFICLTLNGGTIEFYPSIIFPPLNALSFTTLVLFSLFFMLPLFAVGGEAAVWRYSISKI